MGFSGGRVCETWASRVWVVVGVCETWASRACFMAPDMGSFGEAGVVWVSWGRAGCEAGVVWVSVGARVETWAAPVWVVVGVRETRASRACSMAPDMGSFGEAGVVWVSLGACGVCSRGGLGFTWGACVKTGPPLCGLLWACVKPEAPVPVSWRLIWGVLAKRGWSGFQRARAHRSQGGLGFAGFTNRAFRPSQPRPPVAHGSTRIRPAARWAESPPTGRWAGRAGPRSPAPARCHSRAERPRRPETRR